MTDTTKPVLSVRAALQALVSDIECNSAVLGHAVADAHAALAAPFGLTVEQESKYTTCPHTGAIMNRLTGKPIPPDEPIMIFRAQDVHACATVRRYGDLVNNAIGSRPTEHQRSYFGRYQQFIEFAEQHPERMKKPD